MFIFILFLAPLLLLFFLIYILFVAGLQAMLAASVMGLGILELLIWQARKKLAKVSVHWSFPALGFFSVLSGLGYLIYTVIETAQIFSAFGL